MVITVFFVSPLNSSFCTGIHLLSSSNNTEKSRQLIVLGNCLYYALSDQVYGDFTHGEEIRTRLADHMSENKEYFMSFIAASGGERRAPRRAASLAVRYSSCPSLPSTANRPSAKDHEQSFDTKVAYSRKSGVWGGAEEIQAFCQSFKLDVNVYTMYGVQRFRDVNAPEGEERATVHIAFHVRTRTFLTNGS